MSGNVLGRNQSAHCVTQQPTSEKLEEQSNRPDMSYCAYCRIATALMAQNAEYPVFKSR